MPASRALPEPGEPLTTVLEARAARRRGAGEARRSEAKRGEAGCRRRPEWRYRQIGREAFHGTPNTLADARRPRKRTAKREELLRQMGTAIPWGHACSARETALLRRTTGGASLQASSGEGVLSSSPESDQIGTSIIDQRFPRLCGSGGLTAAGTC